MMGIEENIKSGTRIFKKSTPNGKLTIYLRKRDFIDHLTHVDPVEGVVLVDREYVKDRKVFINLLGAFRYGREEVDLLGLNYHRDIYVCTKQVYPSVNSTSKPLCLNGTGAPNSSEHPNLTCLQERLIRKLGNNAFPFYFQLPSYSASSVSLLLSPSDTSKPCRVDYELRVYVADDRDDKPQKRNSVRMVIRKLTYAPQEPGPQPTAEVRREFLMSVGSLRAEATLDKQKYYHGESLSVNILVDNNSSKSVKRIKLSVRQYTQAFLHNAVNYKCNVFDTQSEEGFPIFPSQTGWCKVYRLRPLFTNNRDKIGLAVDGDLKHEDTNLASSTIDPPSSVLHNPIGITVQYKVKIRLVLGFGLSDVCLELPFILTHPNSEEKEPIEDALPVDIMTEPTSTATASIGYSIPLCPQPSTKLVDSIANSPAPMTTALIAEPNLAVLPSPNLPLFNGDDSHLERFEKSELPNERRITHDTGDLLQLAIQAPTNQQVTSSLVPVSHNNTIASTAFLYSSPTNTMYSTLFYPNNCNSISHASTHLPAVPSPVSPFGASSIETECHHHFDQILHPIQPPADITNSHQGSIDDDDRLFEHFARLRLHSSTNNTHQPSLA